MPRRIFSVSETVRVFIAFPIAPTLRREAVAVGGRLQNLPCRVSWVRAENMHLTLRFLGEVPTSKLSAIGLALGRVVRQVSPFTLRFSGLGAFPPRGAPRTLWIGVDGDLPQVRVLHGLLQEELRALGFPPKEHRLFSPHLTLGRVRTPLGRSVWERVRDGLGSVEVGSEPIDRLALIRSNIEPGCPPSYETLDEAHFGTCP